jgi:DNA-binding response OmpR family regulator
MTVLIVEDDKVTLRILSKLLKVEGYNVISATDGNLAVKYIKEKMPDLIITDIMLPGLNGLGIIEEVRRNEKTCKIPIIVMSVLDEENTIIEALQKGADDFVKKPLNFFDLSVRVKRYLNL